MTDYNLMKFLEDYDIMMNFLIKEYKFNFKLRNNLRKFKKYLTIKECSCNLSNNLDEYFDATASIEINGLSAQCPIEINITKLLKKDLSQHLMKCRTNELYELIPNSTKEDYDEDLEFAVKNNPIILLKDTIFNFQVIDGNHRVIKNKHHNDELTDVYLVNISDIFDCIDNEIYQKIIILFKDILSCIK